MADGWRWQQDGGVTRWQKGGRDRRMEVAEGWRWQKDGGVAWWQEGRRWQKGEGGRRMEVTEGWRCGSRVEMAAG